MSLATLRSRALTGMDAPEVAVEVHLANGLPAFNLVGLPETEVKESRERVRSAIQNARFEFPQRRITVNLAPADLPKESGRFDLPIALGILAASGQILGTDLDAYEFAGELSLSGELRPVRGALAMTCRAVNSRRQMVLPRASAEEAALVEDARILPASSLLEVCAHLCGREALAELRGSPMVAAVDHPDFADVRGQAPAKRALEVAAAGAHSVLMVGPPGSGKSMLAARVAGVLPPMTTTEALESAAVHSLAGGFRPADWGRRPLRAPHHSASAVALVGGGGNPRPGEISLAHHGVLFLDELPEFDRRVLEALREPLEAGRIAVSRAARSVEFPARFQLVAAMNPCPCGRLGDPRGRCRCTPDQVSRYRARVSGPLLDRIDVCMDVPAVPEGELLRRGRGEASATVRARVIEARARQTTRQGKPNAELLPAEIDALCEIDERARALIAQASARFGLSARAYHRVLMLARTVADLAGDGRIAAAHVAEAIGYRRGLAEG